MEQKEETATIPQRAESSASALMSCYHPDRRAEVFQDIAQQLHCQVNDLFIARAHTDSDWRGWSGPALPELCKINQQCNHRNVSNRSESKLDWQELVALLWWVENSTEQNDMKNSAE